ncbi:MAG: L-glutamate gamma-semialdehyde dehydrogenase [Luteitalea sp.]|nr:L-glutamate gamma-semialdehyde dehydrogenase [Luteitalea sp.]
MATPTTQDVLVATPAPGASPAGAEPVTVGAFAGRRHVPLPVNEPVRSYAPGTAERATLKSRLAAIAAERIEVPLVIGGKEYRTGDMGRAVMPHDHGHVLADWHRATPELVEHALEAARQAQAEWARWSWEDRAAVFLRAADLLATTWRDTLNAATMLGQSKTAFQAEIDSACELIDFYRFNVSYAQALYGEQPISSPGIWNTMEYRPLEGFVYAISPFNFTAIGGNLTGSPALMGNVVLWKPASSAILSAYYTVRLLEAAGLPPGVINFVPGNPVAISERVLSDPDLAGVHFTGSTDVFNGVWKTIGGQMARYRSYPRVVGETGGKNFVVVHASADAQAAAVAIVRGAYEYQGQKCSAASRVYVPRSLWPDVRDRIVEMVESIGMGDIRDFRNFMGAVIDAPAFQKISGYLEDARRSAKILVGGHADDRQGWFIQPTLIEADDPSHRLLCEEIFGPVVTAYVYPDDRYVETMRVVDRTSPYALTGAIFARDRHAVRVASDVLRHAAGNFYINDKPTGAVVGQQPFGGARASGTNDKAGSKLNLLRWVSTRSIKETFVPPTDYRYPFMLEE